MRVIIKEIAVSKDEEKSQRDKSALTIIQTTPEYLGTREQARTQMVPQSSASADGDSAISKVAQAAPDSKDTLKTLRIAHVAALKGSRYRVLDEDGYDALAPQSGGCCRRW